MKDTAIIVCSRSPSSRLPGKAFKPVAGIPALYILLDRLLSSNLPVVVAVPNMELDDYRARLSQYKGSVDIFGGSDDSPLHRTAEWLYSHPDVAYVVRVTHDDITPDIRTMEVIIDEVRKAKAGYGYSPKICEGMGIEVISRENIIHAATGNGPTEYISYFVKGEKAKNKTIVKVSPRASVCRDYRLTMDYEADWQVLNFVLSKIGPMATTDDICRFIDHHAEIMRLNSQPDITFYTCAHNAEQTIFKTMLSVLTMSGNFEYIIIDDASTDNTLVEISGACNDTRLKVITNPQNLGLASCSNKAVSMAKGKYIVRVDADDMLMPKPFAYSFPQIEAILENEADIVYTAYNEIGEGHEVVAPEKNHHAGCSVMKKSVLNEYRFRDGLRHWDGLELYNRIKEQGKVGYYNTPIWFYRVSKHSMSHGNTDTRAKMKIELGLDGVR